MQKAQNEARNERMKKLQLQRKKDNRPSSLLVKATVWIVMGALGAAILAIYIPALGWGSLSGQQGNGL